METKPFGMDLLTSSKEKTLLREKGSDNSKNILPAQSISLLVCI